MSNTTEMTKETLFYHNISQDKYKLEIYNQAVSEGKITDFDQTTLTRLRKLYYGLYSGLIYMYYDPTSENNIANKAELMTHVLEDKSYQLVHGETDSTRNMSSSTCKVKNFTALPRKLYFNSWLEVQEGQKVWVYDLFSMLRIEKDIYYKLENPTIKFIVSKESIMSHPGRDRDDYKTYSDGGNFMLLDILPRMEKNLANHSFSRILAPEITRYKRFVNFDNLEAEIQEEMAMREELERKRNHSK